MTKLMPAFIKAQSEIHNARLDSKNPHFKSSYASLESVLDAVKPTLNKYGIAVLQPLVEEGDKLFVITKLIHESGEMIESKTPVIFEKQTAQAMGSGISYSRRYSLAALVCIGADDDDANEATQPRSGTSGQRNSDAFVDKFLHTLTAIEPAAPTTPDQYVVPFGKSKGKKLGELGAEWCSDTIYFVNNKASEKFAKSPEAQEFLKRAAEYLAMPGKLPKLGSTNRAQNEN